MGCCNVGVSKVSLHVLFAWRDARALMGSMSRVRARAPQIHI